MSEKSAKWHMPPILIILDLLLCISLLPLNITIIIWYFVVMCLFHPSP